MDSITLQIVPGEFALCRLDPDADIELPTWSFAGRTAEELSFVCREEDIPARARKAERGYACLRVAGVLDLRLTGILAKIAGALGEAKIPIFPVSTFDTDYIFVPASRLDAACEILRSRGMPTI